MDKILNEYKEKLATGELEELLRAPTYAMIIMYFQTEHVDEEYMNHILKQDNSLDYLYGIFTKFRTTKYEEVKNIFDFDQISY